MNVTDGSKRTSVGIVLMLSIPLVIRLFGVDADSLLSNAAGLLLPAAVALLLLLGAGRVMQR